jgi:hypothetical protein
MFGVFNGITFSVSQPVKHPRRRFPGNFSVGSQVSHCITGLFEISQDLSDEGLLALA